ncbi:TetR/AcrR family transcriptional regulator [Vulcanisaeta sp. JCM 16159]|uniref:TetR/AcrR family transcriptional regulator n=1 Tax=Vulcanisaeta sp. JCM 16159 TaxID=1295371 RepID=UPI0006D06FF6|nr:TetR/AcrR family transcriptional regulator [Vulcanisaeta sp. JCM 16159]
MSSPVLGSRERILQAASEVFAEEGFFRASVDEVCSRAGVSKGLVFWYFKSKDQLIIEVARRSIPLDVVEDCLGRGGGGYEILRCIGIGFLGKYRDSVMRRLFLHTISAMNVYRELEESVRELCRSMVVKISRVVFNDEGPEGIVRIRAFLGGLLCYVINPPGIDEETYVNTLMRITLSK